MIKDKKVKRLRKNPLYGPDITRLEGTVHPNIIKAMIVASEQFKKLGVRHMLIGGLALGAYGYIRATKDVDFLVGDEGFEHFAHGLIATAKGIPTTVNGIQVDTLATFPGEDYIEPALDGTVEADGIPVAPVEVLIYLKLKAHRLRDISDITQLLEAGVDPKPVMTYLKKNCPELVQKFTAIIQRMG
jgi:hypothetical protein